MSRREIATGKVKRPEMESPPRVGGEKRFKQSNAVSFWVRGKWDSSRRRKPLQSSLAFPPENGRKKKRGKTGIREKRKPHAGKRGTPSPSVTSVSQTIRTEQGLYQSKGTRLFAGVKIV